MPGLRYNFDQQCKFAFGINATHCINKRKVNLIDDYSF